MTLHQSTLTTTKVQPVPEKDFEWGPLEAGWRYCRRKKDGREFAVLERQIEVESYSLRQGELLISVREELTIDGSPWHEVRTKVAMPVPDGCLDATHRRQDARKARQRGADRPLRTWSAIGDLFRTAQGDDSRRVVLGKVPEDADVGAMQAALGTGGPKLVELTPKTVDTSPAGILRYLADRGVELTRGTRDGTRLVARSRLQLSDFDRTLLHRMEPLLVASLAVPRCCAPSATSRPWRPSSRAPWRAGSTSSD